MDTAQRSGGASPESLEQRPAGAAATGQQALAALLVAAGLAWLGLSSRRAQPLAPSGVKRRAEPQPPDGGASRPGGAARSPTQVPPRGWWQILQRVMEEVGKDNVSIIAAGCAFYAVLALFPAVTALVSIYGLVADPATVQEQISGMASVVPQEALALIEEQARAVAASGQTALGWGAALAIGLALYSASAGVRTLFEALNIVYEEEETRGYVRFYLTAFAFTLAAVLGIAIMIAVIVVVPVVLSFLPLGPLATWTVRIVSWLIVLTVIAVGLALLYRFGPSRAPASWRWLTPGSIVATVLCLVASLGFSFYAANFGSYNQAYGTVAGVIILLLWLWISAFVVLLGAELNAEIELQTDEDTTTGPPRPRGQREAYVADHGPHERARDPKLS